MTLTSAAILSVAPQVCANIEESPEEDPIPLAHTGQVDMSLEPYCKCSRSTSPRDLPNFSIYGTELQAVPLFFSYPGSIVTSTTKINNDIFKKINNASHAFSRLKNKVFQNKLLRLIAKSV